MKSFSTPPTSAWVKAGGAGASDSITGSAIDYAGGGSRGIGKDGNNPRAAGTGGGGAGGNTLANGSPGTVNLGGGGGGSVRGSPITTTGGAGGSGVGILRMLTADYSGITTGNPTVSVDGLYTVLKFTGSGTYTG